MSGTKLFKLNIMGSIKESKTEYSEEQYVLLRSPSRRIDMVLSFTLRGLAKKGIPACFMGQKG